MLGSHSWSDASRHCFHSCLSMSPSFLTPKVFSPRSHNARMKKILSIDKTMLDEIHGSPVSLKKETQNSGPPAAAPQAPKVKNDSPMDTPAGAGGVEISQPPPSPAPIAQGMSYTDKMVIILCSLSAITVIVFTCRRYKLSQRFSKSRHRPMLSTMEFVKKHTFTQPKST